MQAQATFTCADCGEEAATVSLLRRGASDPRALEATGSAGTIVISGFIGVHSEAAAPASYEAVREALAENDAGALHQVNRQWAPFYCPTCKCCYCIRHWHTEIRFDADFPSWHDATYGICPRGHRRMLDD